MVVVCAVFQPLPITFINAQQSFKKKHINVHIAMSCALLTILQVYFFQMYNFFTNNKNTPPFALLCNTLPYFALVG